MEDKKITKPKVVKTKIKSVNTTTTTRDIILMYREQFKDNKIKKSIQKINEDTAILYYGSGDLFTHADEFIRNFGYYLDLNIVLTDNKPVMTLDLISGTRVAKTTLIPLGSPSSMEEMGARITYLKRYLIATLFGIDIQTEQFVEEEELKEVATLTVEKYEEPTNPSFQRAKAYIEKSVTKEMLDEANTKIDLSKNLTEKEKLQLKELIAEKLKEIK